MAVENNFAPQPSKDQAIAELVKANADSLDVVYANALAHEALPARTELAISLLRQLSSFPERFGVEPLVVLPADLDVVGRIPPQDPRGPPQDPRSFEVTRRSPHFCGSPEGPRTFVVTTGSRR